MKKFTLSRVLDGFRSSVSQGPGQDGKVSGPAKNQEGPLTEIAETLRPDNFQITQVRYTFPCLYLSIMSHRMSFICTLFSLNLDLKGLQTITNSPR